MRTIFVLGLVALSACNRDEAPPPTAPPVTTATATASATATATATATASATATATATATMTATATASATPTPTPSASASATSGLPALDAHCSVDADCGATTLVLEDTATQCCTGCGTSTAGTTQWVASVAQACQQLLRTKHKMCPMLRCVGGITRTACRAGTCVLVR